MYFARMLSLMNWFDLQIDSNDVNVNIFFHIQVQADLKHLLLLKFGLEKHQSWYQWLCHLIFLWMIYDMTSSQTRHFLISFFDFKCYQYSKCYVPKFE